MKYRKKPIVIEAFQITEERYHNTSEWPSWLSCDRYDGTLYVTTLEGNMKVCKNDWIIKGVKDELYPCKPDIFEAIYEEVVE